MSHPGVWRRVRQAIRGRKRTGLRPSEKPRGAWATSFVGVASSRQDVRIGQAQRSEMAPPMEAAF
jgi:hypothetical protein